MQRRSCIRFFSFIAATFNYTIANALCPVCTFATGLGIGFSRKLGIDDSITGLWIGGLIASSIAWTINILTRHNIKFLGRKPLIALLYVIASLWPLYHYGYIGIPGNILWGYDKLVLGIIIGMVTFTFGCLWYAYQKKQHGERAQFPFQKVLMPIGLLTLMSIIFYCITRLSHG